jgi:chromosome partitioning protein
MKTISVSNQKGGCAKTTTTINLAGALAVLGKKVLVIDLDPQAHASFGLGMSNRPADTSIYSVLTENSDKRKSISECIVNVSQNLDLISSNILLSTLEQELKDKDDAVAKLHNILAASKLDYDYAIIDCPPSLGFLTFNSLRAAELVIVPIDMSAFSLMGVGKLLGLLELINIKIGHAPRVNALATIFDKRTKYSQTMLEEIKHFFKTQMFDTVMRTSVALKKAAFAGVPVVQLERESNGAIDHLALAKEILRQDGAAEFELALEEVSEKKEEQPIKIIPRKEVVEAQKNLTSHTLSSKDITFLINNPAAKEIHIVGDFNGWKINDETRLSKRDDGRWEKSLALDPGKYKYKFVVDGEWVLDSQNTEKEQNSYGTFDSIIKL